MAETLSSYLGIKASDLSKKGVLDCVIGVDAHLFVDPHLLRRTRISEFRAARQKVEQHFAKTLRLIEASRAKGDAAWREACRRLTFPELRGVSIGYGVTRSDGNAIGTVLAARLLDTASQIAKLGVDDPEMFELIGLFEEDFGADRLSDMTIWIIQKDLFRYSARITQALRIRQTRQVDTPAGRLRLPQHPNGRDPLLFLPKSLLRDLPVALSWDDISGVVAANKTLRAQLNSIIGRAWKKGQRVSKSALRNLILRDAAALKALIEAYRANSGGAYDLDDDPKGLLSWFPEGQRAAARNPISLALPKGPTLSDVEAVIGKIVAQFKRNVEVNGLNEHLYQGPSSRRKPLHERFSQLLFFSVADSYCEANNLDLSREPNAGSGPVDFKISSGYDRRILVEIKLSSNPRLVQGFEKQLPGYEASEAARRSFYVVIRVTDSEANIRRLDAIRAKCDSTGTRHPTVVVVDGRLRPSASKRP